MELLYRVPCPMCGHTTDLLETSLSKIIQARQLSRTGESFLTFVCQGCTAAFRYDYRQRVAAEAIAEGDQTKRLGSRNWFSVVAGCNHYDNPEECDDALVKLLAIRPSAISKNELIEAEMPIWNLSAIRCKNGHPIVRPDPTKACEHSDMDQD